MAYQHKFQSITIYLRGKAVFIEQIHILIQLLQMADSRTFLQLSSAAVFKHYSIKSSCKHGKEELSPGSNNSSKKKIQKCSERCKRHLFSMVRTTSSKEGSVFMLAKYGIQHRFCPSYNRLIGIQEGGIPSFNRDQKIETPSFLTKYDKFQSQINASKICRERFRENLAKATNSTFQGTEVHQRQLTLNDFNKLKDQSQHEIISEFMAILKAKEVRCNRSKPKEQQ